MREFRIKCEEHCKQEIGARVIVLTNDGSHEDLHRDVTTSRLFQNLTDGATCMGFYDVKNAKLVELWNGESP